LAHHLWVEAEAGAPSGVVEAVKEDGMAGKCMLRKTERMTNGAVLNDMTPYHSEAAVMIE